MTNATPNQSSQDSGSARRWISFIFIAAVLLIIILTLSSIILTGRLSHDEHMYLSAAHLLGDYSLYKDFAYFQTPYMPYVYHWASMLPGTDHVLTTARLVKILIVTLLILAVFFTCSRLTRDRWFALACALLLANNDIFRHSIPYATNLDMASLLVVAAFLLTLRADSNRRPSVSTVICGVFVGLAIGTKMTFALVPLCFLLPIPALYGRSGRRLNSLFLFTAGLVAGIGPAIYICLAAGVDTAIFNNFGYHRLNALWRAESGFEIAMTLPEKLYFARHQLLELTSALLLMLAAGLSILRIRTGFPVSIKRETAVFGFALFVPVCVLMFMIPTPIWRSYLSPFVISVALFIAALYSELTPGGKRPARLIVWIGVAVLLLANAKSDAGRLGVCFKPDQWMGEEIHKRGQIVRSVVSEDQRHRPVATLSLVYALEAGLPIYPELATGQFAYRIGGLLSDVEISRYHTASAGTIAALLDESPPSAVFVGFATDLDSTLARYAETHGYQKHTVVTKRAYVYSEDPGGPTD